MRVVFSTGEASGDAYAAALARKLRDHHGFTDLKAAAGRRFAEVGELVADSSQWGAIGIAHSLAVVPKVFAESRPLVQELKFGTPGTFVPIDFGYLNVKLARAARDWGWKVVYFCPPGSWRRDRQGGDLPLITDAIITQFDWSERLLRARGANAHWFGHPLNEMVADVGNRPTREVGRVAVLPGSRLHEIRHNLAAIGAALALLPGRIHAVDLVAAPTVDPVPLLKVWESVSNIPAEVSTNGAYVPLMRAQAGVICSGTATLESAICGCPCVVVYRGSKWMEIEFTIRKPKFDYISLPNILLDQPLLPELLQHDAHPERIAAEVIRLLDDPTAQLRGFADLDQLLGPNDAITRSAKFIAGF
jgi:lipid-A-disaccharide synthase